MLFKLTEYALAEASFVESALQALSRSRGGLVNEIAREPSDRVNTTQVTTDAGETVELEPSTVVTAMHLESEDIVQGRVEALIETIDEAAGLHHEALSKYMFESLESLTEATGMQVDGTGKSFFEAFYEMLDKVEMSFESDGSISKGFALVTHPDTFETIKKAEAEMTDEQRKALDELIDRKRQEYFARRRRRQLS